MNIPLPPQPLAPRARPAPRHATSAALAIAAAALLAAAAAPARADDANEPPRETFIRIVAIVNDAPITSYELESVCQLRRDFRDLKRQNPGDPQLDLMRSRVLQLMIDERLLLKVAAAEGIRWTAADEVELKEALVRKAETHGSIEALDDSLRKLGVKPEFLRDRLKVDIMLGKLFLRKISKNIFVRPEDMQRYYEDNKGEFYLAARVVVRQIFVAFGNQKAEARVRAEQARSRILAGDDFDTVARELSEGPRRDDGGVWPFDNTSRPEMIPPVGEKADALEVGQVSDVFESRKGFHVIRVEERRRRAMKTFDEVQNSIQDTLRRREWDKRLQQMIDAERAKATIRIIGS